MERRSVIEQHVCTRSPKHHRALAGGASTSSLQNNHPYLLLGYHRLKPGGVQEGSHKVLLAERLKYHRLKPGGVHEFGSL